MLKEGSRSLTNRKGRWYMFDFDKPIDRRGTTSIKWNCLDDFAPHDDMLPYWIADTDFATVPEVVEALKKRLEHPVFGYANPLPSTFEAIQGWYERRYGWKPETEWMFITCGVVMGIYFALQAYTQPGDKVVTLTPVYDPFFAAVNNSGRTLVRCPLHHEDNYYTINFDKLEKAFQDGAKAIIFCNPHNPVSRVWSAQELERVAGLCKKYGVWLLCDEVHSDYGLTRRYTPMGKVAQGYEKLVIYTAPSKTFNLAGMVSACIMVPDKTAREKLQYEFDSRWMFGPSDLSFTAIEAAYTHGDTWMDAMCAYIQENVEIVHQYIAEHMPKIGVTRGEGTFLMWLDMTCTGKTGDELTAILSGEYGVALGNGHHYDEDSDGFMRLNIGCTHEVLRQGLARMEQFYKDYVK